MKEREFHADQKIKAPSLNEETSKNILNLTIMIIKTIWAKFNPNKSKKLLDKYEEVRRQLRLEIKSCLTWWVKLKGILKLNLNSNQDCFGSI